MSHKLALKVLLEDWFLELFMSTLLALAHVHANALTRKRACEGARTELE